MRSAPEHEACVDSELAVAIADGPLVQVQIAARQGHGEPARARCGTAELRLDVARIEDRRISRPEGPRLRIGKWIDPVGSIATQPKEIRGPEPEPLSIRARIQAQIEAEGTLASRAGVVFEVDAGDLISEVEAIAQLVYSIETNPRTRKNA